MDALTLLNASTAVLLGLLVVAAATSRRQGAWVLLGLLGGLGVLAARNALLGMGRLAPSVELALGSLAVFTTIPLLLALWVRRVVRPELPSTGLAAATAVVPALTLLGFGAWAAQQTPAALPTLGWQSFAVGFQGLAAACGVWMWRDWRTSERPPWVAVVVGAFGIHWGFSTGSWATAVFVDAPGWGVAFEALSLVTLLGFGAAAVVLGLRRLPLLETEAAEAEAAPAEAAPAEAAPAEAAQAERYARDGLGDAERRRLAAALREQMRTQRLYLDPELSAAALAAHLGASPRELSEVLNVEIGQRFFEFVNGHRVAEAQRRLRDPEHADATILEVLYASGFNSKSAFHRAFREAVGTTPSAYRRQGAAPRHAA